MWNQFFNCPSGSIKFAPLLIYGIQETSNTSIAVTSDSLYSLTISNGSCSDTDSINIKIVPRPIITNGLVDTSLCEGQYEFAPSYQNGYLQWYDAQGNSLSEIDTLEYNVLDTSIIYYQAQQVQEKRYTVGEQDLVTNTLYSAKPAQVRGIEFEVFEPITLSSVDIDVDAVGVSGTIKLYPGGLTSTPLYTTAFVSVQTGVNTVQLNYTLSVGTYVISFEDQQGGKVKSTYPYASGNWNNFTYPFMKINESVPFNVVYQYFYNWKVLVNEDILGCNSGLDSAVLIGKEVPILELGEDTLFCGGSYLVTPQVQSTLPLTYAWNTNSITNSITVVLDSLYSLTVSNGLCSVTDSVSVSLLPRPIITNGLVDTSLCEGRYKFAPSYQEGYLQWSNMQGNLLDKTDTLEYNVLDTSIIYYQVQQTTEVLYTVGEQDLATNTLYSAKLAQTRGIEFEVFEPITLSSVDIDVDAVGVSGTVKLYPTSLTSTPLYTTAFVSGQTGVNTVQLNYTLSVGTYVISFEDQQGGKVKSTYPYALGNWNNFTYPFMKINESVPFNVVYQYFYNWKVLVDEDVLGCDSGLDSLKLTYLPTPKILLPSDTTACQGPVLVDATYNAPGSTTTYQWNNGLTSPLISVGTDSSYKVTATINTCSTEDSINVFINEPPVASILSGDTTVCAGTIERKATGTADVYHWYTDTTGGSFLGSGENLAYNAINTDTIWVEGLNYSGQKYKVNNTANFIGGTSLSYPDRLRGLEFDVTEQLNLKEVSVIIDRTLEGQVYLWDANDNPIDSTGWFIKPHTGATSGTYTITLDFDIPVGSNYKIILGYRGLVPPLRSNRSFSDWPITGSDLSITGGYPIPNSYDYFFDWKYNLLSCPSARASSEITVLPTPTINLPTDTVICGDSITLDAAATNATAFEWLEIDALGVPTRISTSSSIVVKATMVVDLKTSLGVCKDSMRINSTLVDPPSIVIVPADTVLCAGIHSFTATGDADSYVWYADANATNKLGLGEVLEHSLQAQTADYRDTLWVEGVGFMPLSSTYGETETVVSNSSSLYTNLATSIQSQLGLVFDVHDAMILNSVTIYVEDTIAADIEIYQGGVKLSSKAINLGDGKHKITLNEELNKGNDYLIAVGNIKEGKLLKLYPYSMNKSYLTNSNFTIKAGFPTVQANAYNFFFDWKISTLGCGTALEPFEIYVPNTPVINMPLDTAACAVTNILLEPSFGTNDTANYIFSWSNGSLGDTLFVINSGYYQLSVSNQICSAEQDINVQLLNTSVAYTVNDTSICTPDVMSFGQAQVDDILLWSDDSLMQNTLFLGAPFLRNISASTSYWVQAAPKATTRVGDYEHPNLNAANVYKTPVIASEFNVYKGAIFDSVAMYVDKAPSTFDLVIYQLGKELVRRTVTITKAGQKCFVPIDTFIPVGLDYSLGIDNYGATEFAAEAKNSLNPTSSAGIVEIIGGSYSTDFNAFYDWHFSYGFPQCRNIADVFNIDVVLPITLADTVEACDSAILDVLSPNAVSYSWSTGVSTPSIIAYEPGLYTLTVSDGTNCTFIDSIRYEEPVPLNILDGFTSCDSILFSNYTASMADSFLWNTGDKTPEIRIPSTGQYSLTVTTSQGCVRVDTGSILQIIAPPNPVLSSAQTLYACDSVELDAGITGQTLSYTWNTGATTQKITTKQNGFYMVTVTSPLGCSGESNVSVSLLTKPQADFNVFKLQNNIADFEAKFPSGQGALHQYLFEYGDGNQSSQASPIHVYPDTGCYYIKFTLTNICGVDDTARWIGIGLPDTLCGLSAGAIQPTAADALTFELFPNPTTGYFDVFLSKEQFEAVSIQIFNVQGQLVLAPKMLKLGTNTVRIDGRQLSNGVYFVRLTNGLYTEVKQLILQH